MEVPFGEIASLGTNTSKIRMFSRACGESHSKFGLLANDSFYISSETGFGWVNVVFVY